MDARRWTAAASGLMTGATFGVALWAGVSVVLVPAVLGSGPMWTAPEMRELLPQLVAWVLVGAAVGAAAWAVRSAPRLNVPAPTVGGRAMPVPQPRRVVILGGGFAGVTCARELERLLGADRSVAITLVSETNSLLFTPMLAEVAGSSLEPTHISTPIRSSVRRTDVLRGRAERVDLQRRVVVLSPELEEPAREIPFDHLVLALGAVSSFFGNAALEREAIGFKSLSEAMRIRNRVIDLFERAARTPSSLRRRELLTIVVAGGGFAGAELAGALNDFARGMLADHPSLRKEDIRVVLVHAGDRILPELSPALAAYALERMTSRGVEIRLGRRVRDARPGLVTLDDGEAIRAETLVWTAGTRPHPLIAALPVERDRRGALVVDTSLAVPGVPGLWAAGDCAAVTDARTRKPCPPTAQFALREARQLARNLHAVMRGHQPKPFHFDSLGALCVVGHQTACAELTVPFARHRSVRLSGLLAWLLWRTIYLSKLPGWEKRIRVAADWTLELFFPRDVVQTIDLGAPAAPPPDGEVKHAS